MKVFIMYKDRCTYIIVKDLTAAVNFIDKQKLMISIANKHLLFTMA